MLAEDCIEIWISCGIGVTFCWCFLAWGDHLVNESEELGG